MGTDVATPWGRAQCIDEVRLDQRVDGKRFSSLVQLLERGDGERLVRFAYATGGAARRGPVTLRARDVVRLKTELAKHPELGAALGLEAGGSEAGGSEAGGSEKGSSG